MANHIVDNIDTDVLYERVRSFGHPADESMFPEISCYDDHIDNEIDAMMGEWF